MHLKILTGTHEGNAMFSQALQRTGVKTLVQCIRLL